MAKSEVRMIANNKKAYHDYFILEKYEAGIVLHGTEVKSLRMGKCSIKEAFIRVESGEMYIYGMHISPYEKGNIFNKDPLRVRKLLLHKKEIDKMFGKMKEQGITLVPLQVYFKGSLVKMEIGVAKGKKLYDKRDDIAKKDQKREDKDSIALYYEDHAALMKVSEKGISFPSFADLEHLNREIYKECIYLFSVDDERYYLVNEIDRSMLLDFQMKNTEIFRTADPQDRAFAGITGYQLYNWYKDRKYCGRCGKRLKHGEKERMLVCEACGNTEFPKICPAVIVGVTDHNRILMSKYAGRTYKKYALLAGFSEIGETVEQTVAREVMEEVGLKVKNIRYYKSQPWAFSDTLLMGFYCDLDGNDAITLDREELAVAEWFEREDIPVEPSRDSLTNEMILQFKNERTAVKKEKGE